MAADQLTLLPTGEFINVSGISPKLSTIFPVDKFIPLLSTGLNDKNGKEIFDGDILEGERHNYPVAYDSEYAQFSTRLKHSYIPTEDWGKYGTIGNIYENPELLN